LAIDVEHLYRRYGPFVLRRCQRMLGDEQHSREAMQDVFVQILRRRETVEDKGLGGLLHRTATNVCLNRLRSQQRKPRFSAGDLIATLPSRSRDGDRVEAREMLRVALEEHPESSATIVMLHLHDGLTLEQTARMVGMSVSGVRHRLRVLRTTLEGMRTDV